jgi:beta-lactamase regulating signal transducer with metallopeptidase domain
MPIDGVVSGAVDWALTYAVHSSLLLGLAALVSMAWIRSDVWRETLWRAALLGPVVTATIALALPFSPLAGRFERAGRARGPDAAAVLDQTPPPAGTDRDRNMRTEPQPGRLVSALGAGDWDTPLVLFWAGGALLALGVLGYRNIVMYRHLRGREPMRDGPLVEMLAELRRNAGVWRPVRLGVADACPTPIVLGRSEICVPPRFLDELGRREQRAALAHELAHIRRRDPIWQFGTGLLNALLFFQPLNVVARLRLRESAENLCDDWAVWHTGSSIALSRCLAEIAAWASADPPRHLQGTPAMAEGGSPLVDRIRRIADGARSRPERRAPSLALALMALALTAWAAPAAERVTSMPSATTSTANQDRRAHVELLESVAMQGATSRERQEATAELSDVPDGVAGEALARIVRRATDSAVRAEAAQQLDEFPNDEVVAVLLEVVREDTVAAVRMNAIDVLDDFPLESARGALRRLAVEHPLTEVRRAALSALSD